MNGLRQKIQNNEKILGTLVCLSDPCLCEIIGNVGYDCVWIDTEHTYVSYKEVLCHLNGARSSGISTLVRLPQNDLTATKKIPFKIRYISKEVCRILRLCPQMQCLSGRLTSHRLTLINLKNRL